MYLKTKVCDNQLTERLHYTPTDEDINGFYDDPKAFDNEEDIDEFEVYLAELYEQELKDAYAAGYDDLDDYFYDLKHGGLDI